MDTQKMKSISFQKSSQSGLLAQKAKNEMLRTGKVTTTCPKCQNIPKVSIQGMYGERIMVRCKCGYISTMELGI